MKNIFEDDTVARTPRNASQLTMKVLIAAFAVVTAVSALQSQYAPNYADANSGQYVGDDSGQYVPDDSGRYIPDNSGHYIPDGLGGYIGDGSGAYSGGGGEYNGGNGAYKGGAFGGSGGGGGAGNRGTGGVFAVKPSLVGIGSTNLLGSGSNQDRQTVRPSNPYGTAVGQGTGSGLFGNTASATSQVTSKGPKYGGNNLEGGRYDQARYADGRWKIIRQSGDVDLDGYHWEYETENGITAEESGKLANKGTDAEGMKAQGFYQYTGPDNARYHVSYTSDENGFLAAGEHLPTPPPIPAAIIRSLEYLKSIGKL